MEEGERGGEGGESCSLKLLNAKPFFIPWYSRPTLQNAHSYESSGRKKQLAEDVSERNRNGNGHQIPFCPFLTANPSLLRMLCNPEKQATILHSTQLYCNI